MLRIYPECWFVCQFQPNILEQRKVEPRTEHRLIHFITNEHSHLESVQGNQLILERFEDLRIQGVIEKCPDVGGFFPDTLVTQQA